MQPLSCCTSIYKLPSIQYSRSRVHENEERYKQAKLAEVELFSAFKLVKECNEIECSHSQHLTTKCMSELTATIKHKQVTIQCH